MAAILGEFYCYLLNARIAGFAGEKYKIFFLPCIQKSPTVALCHQNLATQTQHAHSFAHANFNLLDCLPNMLKSSSNIFSHLANSVQVAKYSAKSDYVQSP